ncbi:S49 family peptidase, partial [Lysobacter sp. 2RAB21]
IQTIINKGYADFTGRVAAARKKPVEEIDAIARGRVWSGAQAKERGLVDDLGGLQNAIDDVAARAKLGKAGDYRVRYVEKMPTPFERFFAGFASSNAGSALLGRSDLARGLLAKALPQTASDLRFVESAIKPTSGVPVKALAY